MKWTSCAVVYMVLHGLTRSLTVLYGLTQSHTVCHGVVRSIIRLYTDMAPVSDTSIELQPCPGMSWYNLDSNVAQVCTNKAWIYSIKQGPRGAMLLSAVCDCGIS